MEVSRGTCPQEDAAPSCPACDRSTIDDPDCVSAYRRAGIIKAHWECWSDCNLSCSFCYRSRSIPLDTENAKSMLRALVHGGVSQIVFAGGDPSLRRDLGELIDFSIELGLCVEVQTNSQFQARPVLDALLRADLVGLSMDGAIAEGHDAMRGKAGNYSRVMRLANFLESRSRPFVVRTVVSRKSAPGLHGLGLALSGFQYLRRWSLVQFGVIEDGYRNREVHELSDDEFSVEAAVYAAEYSGPGSVNIYPNVNKVGVYFLIGSNGDVFGDVAAGPVRQHPIIGNVTADHARDLALRLKIRPDMHKMRYATLMSDVSH
ncbi:MAG TPA: radical SAM protein [Pseudonocardiaceae bacterium]|nr:radical SAM protein [Pseudonocardiaceae bacterium]